jgi:hypothetical protein
VQEVENNRVLVTYDVPSSSLMQFGVAGIDEVARSLDAKVQRLLDETIARASSQ